MASVPSREERFSRAEPAPPRRRANPVTLILVVPLLGVLLPWIYNTRSPELIGIPFFYWYQMLWVPLSVICTIVVYRATSTRGRR
jgi:hypothetical protein